MSHRTAMGKMVDMGQIVAKNERVRAVGNMKVNARGDTIDARGRVVTPVTKKVGKRYQDTVTNRSANEVNNVSSSRRTQAPVPVAVDEELLESEMEFNNEIEDAEIEAIKVAEAIRTGNSVAKEEKDREALRKDLGFEIKPASEAPDFFEPEPVKKKTK